MDTGDRKIWLDGELVDWDDLLASPTLHYGRGVFEGIRFYSTGLWRVIFRLNDHIRRLFASAKLENLKIPYTEEEIKQAIIRAVRANGVDSGYIRPLIFVTARSFGLRAKDIVVRLAVLVVPWGAYHGEKAQQEGIRLMISSFERTHNMRPKSKACGNYVLSCRALDEAETAGFDDALLLDENALVAEASTSNVFIVTKRGRLLTPPLSSPILAGITRDTILTIARGAGYDVREKEFGIFRISFGTTECFLCGTAAEITPVVRIDRRRIGTGSVGAVTRDLQEIYRDVVLDRIPKYSHWLTYVD